jgi:hypothetical protein
VDFGVIAASRDPKLHRMPAFLDVLEEVEETIRGRASLARLAGRSVKDGWNIIPRLRWYVVKQWVSENETWKSDAIWISA